jgi:hypothetical protein
MGPAALPAIEFIALVAPLLCRPPFADLVLPSRLHLCNLALAGFLEAL